MAQTEVVQRGGLEARGISVTLGSTPVLRDVNIALRGSEVVALLGRSGSGKTTLLRVLCGLQQPDEGEVLFDDVLFTQGGTTREPGWLLRRTVGMVFQGFNLLPHYTARRNITLALQYVTGLPPAAADVEANRVSELLSIQHVLDRFPETLSGGEQQRLALARAIVLRPRVLLLDEVTSALDPEATGMLIDGIEQMRRAQLEMFGRPTAILLVTHALAFAERFADRIAFIANGHLVENLPARQFRDHSSSPEALRYLDRLISIAGASNR